MIGAKINFTKLLGRIQPQTKLYKPRVRIVRATIKENKEHYRVVL